MVAGDKEGAEGAAGQRVGGIVAPPGGRASGLVDVEGTGMSIPVILICGRDAGGTVLVTAGVHSAEHVGIQAAIELAQELRPEEVRGSVIVVPVADPSGFEHRTASRVFEDGKNLNEVFPGDPRGTAAERLAHVIATEFQNVSGHHIDLHCGDGFEALTPYVYFAGEGDEGVVSASRAMAEVADVPYMVRARSRGGSAIGHAGSLGKPSILVERGCCGRWSRPEVEGMKKDVRNVLRHLGTLPGAPEERTHHPSELRSVGGWRSSRTGCWYPSLRPGDTFARGDVLGVVKDYFGRTLDTCTAGGDGVVLYQVCSLCVLDTDDPAIFYGLF